MDREGRRKKREEEKENLERWLLTYADLITLLLAFFIVMYTMSQTDAGRFNTVANELRGIFSREKYAVKNPFLQERNLEILQEKVEKFIEGEKLEKKIETFADQRGLIIRMVDTTLFLVGKAELTVEAKRILDKVARYILDIPNQVRVEGHTDNVPIHNQEFKSNWELSTARATEVIKYLVETHRFSPHRISAAGYGEYRPALPNDSLENRARNRRVEIVVLSQARAKEEPKAEVPASNPTGEK